MLRIYIFIPLIVLSYGLTGCTNKEKSNDFVSDSLKEVVNPPKTAIGNQTATAYSSPISPTLSKPPIGIIIEKDRIIIDTKQTRTFFESLTHKIDQSLQKIENDLNKKRIRSPEESGIVITPNRIELDVNKTEKFIENWIKSMESVGQELDNVFRELDRSLKP